MNWNQPPYQMTLTPLPLRRTEPASFGSADCKKFGVGMDGLEYVLKYVEDAHPAVPASEWICTHMARDVDLAVAPCFVAEDPVNHSLVFATRMEGGTEPGSRRFHKSLLPNTAARLAQWLAFDIFVHNDDRHGGNFLVRDGLAGQILFGIDFSRALLVNDWPKTPPPVQPDSNTLWLFHSLRGPITYPTSEAESTLRSIADLPQDWMAMTTGSVPEEWLASADKAYLDRWWRVARKRRIREMIRTIENGTYLPLLANPRSP